MNTQTSQAIRYAFDGRRSHVVRNVIAKKEDIVLIYRDGVTTWDYDPEFEEMAEKLEPTDEVSYRHYYGFTTDGIYFQRSNFQQHDWCGISPHNKVYDSGVPPKPGDILFAAVEPGKKPGQTKLSGWRLVSEKYMLLVDILRNPHKWGGNTKKMEAIERLDDVSMKPRNYYVMFALAMVYGDFEMLAMIHSLDAEKSVDFMLKSLSESLNDPKIWSDFVAVCIQKGIPSAYIDKAQRFESSFGSVAQAFVRK